MVKCPPRCLPPASYSFMARLVVIMVYATREEHSVVLVSLHDSPGSCFKDGCQADL